MIPIPPNLVISSGHVVIGRSGDRRFVVNMYRVPLLRQDIQQIDKDADSTAVVNDGAKAEIDLFSGDFGCALTIAAAVGAL